MARRWHLTPVQRRALPVGVLLLIPAVIAGVGYVSGLRWAKTPSLPPGIYRLTSNPSDPLISFCPIGQSSKESSERRYREDSWTCPDHHAALLKPVVAKAGDIVTVTKDGINVNGSYLRNSRAFALDGQKLPMHIWPSGIYPVSPGTVWVISSFNRASYDSRYYGPIKVSQILHYGHPVWQFKQQTVRR